MFHDPGHWPHFSQSLPRTISLISKLHVISQFFQFPQQFQFPLLEYLLPCIIIIYVHFQEQMKLETAGDQIYEFLNLNKM